MAKLDLALIVRTVDKATQPLRKIQRGVREIGRQTGLSAVGRDMRRVGQQMGRVGTEAARFGKRFGIVMAAAGAATLLFGQKYAAAADTIAKTADRIGLGIEELQRLRHAFDIGGVSIEKTDKSLEFFAKAIGEAHKGTGEAVEIFDAMGISLQNQDGSLKTTRELLDEVADAMNAQEDPAKRAFAAQRLFGRSGLALVNALSEGSESIRELGSEMDALGLISEEEARRAEQYIDAQARMMAAVRGVGNAIGAELLPLLTPLIDKTREWLVENRAEIVEGFKTAIRELGEIIRWVSTAIDDAVAAGSQFLGWIRETFPAVGRLVDSAVSWVKQFGMVKSAAIVLGGLLAGPLLGAIVGLVAVLTGPVGIILALAAAAAAIYENWDEIAAYLEGIWEDIKAAVDVEGWIETLDRLQGSGVRCGDRLVLRDQRMDCRAMGGDHRPDPGLHQGRARDWRCRGKRRGGRRRPDRKALPRSRWRRHATAGCR